MSNNRLSPAIMNKLASVLAGAALLVLTATSLPAQSYIQLPESLQAGSSPLKVRLKGISTVGKHEFGPYRIIKGKESWTTTRGKTALFSGETQIESNTRISFLFTGSGSDTLTANITLTAATQLKEYHGFFFRTLTGWSAQEVSQNYELYLGNFSSTSDTSQWHLMLAYPLGQEITGEITEEMLSSFKGVLSNNQLSLEIVPELRWENGRVSSLFKPVEGYIFKLEGEAIAAVQTFPLHKRFVWLKEELPADLQFILAGAAASLLVRSYRE